MMKRTVVACAIVFLCSSGILLASDYSQRIRIATVNGGLITNKYSSSGLELKDTGKMAGTYLQWVENNRFQANLFLYYSPDVNYSKVLGYHANADGYFFNSSYGSFVAGADVEGIRIRMDAGSSLSGSGLESFALDNDVLFMMFRGGYKLKLSPSDFFSLSIFPYLGASRELVSGEVSLNPMGPTPLITTDIDERENYLSWGINCTVKVFHFIEFTAKYLAREMDAGRLDSYTAQVNLYLPYGIVADYQYKKMEITSGYDSYHLIGVGYYF